MNRAVHSLSTNIWKEKKKREKKEYLATSEVNTSTAERETEAKRSRSARVLWLFYTKGVRTYFILDTVLVCTVNLSQLTISVLYVQLTVHRDNLPINNQQDASSIRNFILSRNSTRFGHLLCPSSGVISCTRGKWYVSCRLC
jgi:hypothetical protein